jgi:indolepyruvate ferredoxin oxidoreductase beta subunit
MKRTGNIIFCGVGGQGILLASEITSLALLKAGFDVKKSEVHGMAQRGGSVIAHLRYGEKVFSPLIEPGSADIEVAFEMLEALRYITYLNKRSRVIVSTQRIFPPSVATGIEKYPEDVLKQLQKTNLPLFPLDAFSIAKSLGETRTVNLVLVGALSAFIPVEGNLFLDIIDDRVPEKFRLINKEAFFKGKEIIKKGMEVKSLS